jgi:hypothetical protein
MKTEATLMKIGIGIEIPNEENKNYCVNFSNESMDNFIEALLNIYDYGCFGVSLASVQNVNVCGVIGIMFDIINNDKLDITSLKRFLQTKANITIKVLKRT